MKATYNGITMEGTPKEIAELKKLLDEQTVIKWQYTPPYVPNYPWFYTNTPTTIKFTTSTGGNDFTTFLSGTTNTITGA